MGMTCSICSHPKRRQIDAAILEGGSVRNIAKRFGTSHVSIHRHNVGCTSNALARTAESRDRSVADQMRNLLDRCQKHLKIAEKGKKAFEMAATSREVRETMKLLAQLTSELDQSARVAVVFQQQQARADEQALMLERLEPWERAELARLISKAEGREDTAVETPSK